MQTRLNFHQSDILALQKPNIQENLDCNECIATLKNIKSQCQIFCKPQTFIDSYIFILRNKKKFCESVEELQDNNIFQKTIKGILKKQNQQYSSQTNIKKILHSVDKQIHRVTFSLNSKVQEEDIDKSTSLTRTQSILLKYKFNKKTVANNKQKKVYTHSNLQIKSQKNI